MTRIYIKDPYIGHDTHSQRIYPGEYDLHDPLLCGVGQSLLETGYAVLVSEDEPIAEVVEKPVRSGKRAK